MHSAYRIHRATSTHLAESQADALLSIWRASGLHSGASKLNDYYRCNPGTPPEIFMAQHQTSGAWVGTCSLGYRHMQIDGTSILGANRCDLAVIPAHRCGRVAPMLLQQVNAFGRSHTDLVYGFPNRAAEPALARAGFRRLGVFHTYTKILNLGDLVNAQLGANSPRLSSMLHAIGQRIVSRSVRSSRCVINETTHPDNTFDELWNACANTDRLLGVRDKKFLRWRFNPALYPGLRIITAHAATSGTLPSVLLGYAVCVPERGCIRVVDFLARDDEQALPELLRGVFDWSRRTGAHVVHLNFFGDTSVARTLRSLGMWRRRGRAIFAAGRLLDTLAPSQFYLTIADEDT